MDGVRDPDFDFDFDPDMEEDLRTRLRHGRFRVFSGFGMPLQGVSVWRHLTQGVALGYSSLPLQGSSEGQRELFPGFPNDPASEASEDKPENGDMFQAPSPARLRVPVRMTAGGTAPAPERLHPGQLYKTKMQARRLRYVHSVHSVHSGLCLVLAFV